MTHLRQKQCWHGTANRYYFGMTTTHKRKCPAFVNTIHISSIEKNTDKKKGSIGDFSALTMATGINISVFENCNPVIAWDIMSGYHRMHAQPH